MLGCLLIVLAANVFVFWRMANAPPMAASALGLVVVRERCGRHQLDRLRWLELGARRRSRTRRGHRCASARRWLRRGRCARARVSAAGRPRARSGSDDVTFAYPTGGRAGARRTSISRSRPARSLAIVGQNGAGKTTLAKLLCRLYDPQQGAIEIDGVDLRDFDLDAWRSRITAVFQDFVRYELSLRDNVAPLGAPDDVIRAALDEAGAERPRRPRHRARARLRGRHRPVGRPVATRRARARAVRRALGAGVVLLDEPTAQLDVRGEAEIFERVLDARRGCTTDPDLAPLLDCAPRRPDLRGRGRRASSSSARTTS